MKKEPFITNHTDENRETKKENKIRQNISINKLVSLLKERKLTRDIIKIEAINLNIEFEKLGYRILFKSCSLDDFYSYAKKIRSKKNTEIDKEEILYSFFEKIQSENVLEEKAGSLTEKQFVVEEIPVTEAKRKEPDKQNEVVEPEKVETEESIEIKTIPKPERKNWQEVKREAEVMAIEDLDGSIYKFEKHVKTLGVAEKDSKGHWIWKGENKKLVFLGDILGDRNMNGLEIISIIGDLNEQAEKQEGQADHLCGNHDMEFIHFLCKDRKDYAKSNPDHFTRQSIGIWELAKFDPDPNSELKRMEPLAETGSEKVKEEFKKNEEQLWVKLYEKIPEILKNMRTDPEGRVVLEKICNLKVAVVHDDTLFCHTDPTKKMIDDLTRDGNISQRVAEINKIFQDNLRRVLFEDGKFDNDFYDLDRIYLHADNREYFVEEETFENLAGNLFSNILENLYKEKKVKFKKKAEDSLREHGFIGGIGKWENLLTHHLKSLSFDVPNLEEDINNWKKDNNIGGEYLEIVVKILEASRDEKNKNKIVDLFELLREKIEKSNLDDVEKVKVSGINAIIHGHTSKRSNEQYYDEKGLIIVSPHADFGEEKGILTVRENGKINLIGKSFRE